MPDDPKTGSKAQVDRETQRRGREQARSTQAQYEDFEAGEASDRREAASAGPASGAGASYRDLGGVRRRIVGAVAFSVVFALIGVELEGVKSAPINALGATS